MESQLAVRAGVFPVPVIFPSILYLPTGTDDEFYTKAVAYEQGKMITSRVRKGDTA